jgi:hypothetical protein
MGLTMDGVEARLALADASAENAERVGLRRHLLVLGAIALAVIGAVAGAALVTAFHGRRLAAAD